MPNIHVYIDDSYWRNGEDCNEAAIYTLEQCLNDNKALFIIHFNNISEDVIEEYKKTMLGTETGPMTPIVALILKLENGKNEELKIEKDKEYNKSFFTRLPINENRGTIIFSKNDTLMSLEKEYGYGVINSDSFESQEIMLIEKGATIGDRDFASNIKCCNSIVVVDRFALKSEWTIKRNLRPILNGIKSGAPMVLTILSQFTSRTGEPSLTIDRAFEFVKEICPSTDKWSVEIFDVGDKYHDRFIITNNNYVTIGGGLDCREPLGGKMVGSKTTTIHKNMYPLFQKEISKEVKFYIKSIQGSIKGVDRTKKKLDTNNETTNYLITHWI